jgi:hypothetical protein
MHMCVRTHLGKYTRMYVHFRTTPAPEIRGKFCCAEYNTHFARHFEIASKQSLVLLMLPRQKMYSYMMGKGWDTYKVDRPCRCLWSERWLAV